MPPSTYSPLRRRIMCAVMGAILLGTIALAAIASRLANRSSRIELSPQAVTRGNVTVRLPLRWRTPAGTDEDPRVIAQARESTDDERGRSVRVLVDRIETPASPLQYLRDSFGVLASEDEFVIRDRTDNGSMGESSISVTQIGGVDAIVVGEVHVQQRRDDDFVVRKDVYAAAVLPSLEVVTVHLRGAGPLDEFLDHAIVAQIASGITIASSGKTEPPGKPIMLPAEIELRPPAGFVAMEQSDPHRTDRLFWRAATTGFESAEQLEAAWASIEAVGCLFPQFEVNDSTRVARGTAAFQTLLLTRDQSWRGANVSFDEKTGVWRALRAGQGMTQGSGDPGCAYLLPEPGGRALLAIFRGGSGGGGFDALWGEMSASARFRPAADVAQLEDAGAAEAARILRQDVSQLLGVREEQWWIDADASDRPYVGWSSLEWQRGDARSGTIAADVESRRRNFAGDATRITGSFNLRGEGGQYFSSLACEGEPPLKQVASLQRGQLALSFGIGKQEPAILSRAAPPAQFVPGQLLALIMGKIDSPPMLLRTESFIDCPVTGAPALLTVLIRPVANTARTEKVGGEDRPLRCVSAEVSGSGRLSLWYFNSAGEVECVELAGGVQRTASNLTEIRNNFGKNSGMSP